MEARELKRAKVEWLKCSYSVAYWINTYTVIFNATERQWIPFKLWPAQQDTLQTIADGRQVIILKARQLGLSWLVLCYVLWSMLFQPAATVLIFSKRDEEATELLARLKGVYQRLPAWMQARAIVTDGKHDWALSNGSSAKAFPTTGGRSYTGSIVILDEADFVEDLNALLNAVKPTIDAGGQIVMLSTVDKSLPNSPFKEIYRAGRRGETEWDTVFLSWSARPERTPEWYEKQKAEIIARTGALDDLHQEYPETEAEALAPRSLDKRIPAIWLMAVLDERKSIIDLDAPAITGLKIYKRPQPGRVYAIGVDPAEGNPTSDDSAATVMDVLTGEECAVLAGKFQPSTMASHVDMLGHYYNDAGLMVERNNHGHAVLLWLGEHSTLRILKGHDDKLGWLSSSLGKALLYNEMADYFRDNAEAGANLLHSMETFFQLASIEGATLRAPEGEYDDRADSYALANVGCIAMATEVTAMRQAVVAGRPAMPTTRTAIRRAM